MAKWTPKQRLFAAEYLSNNFNGVKAARDAGYAGTDQTLRAVAYENLTKPHIRDYIEAQMAEMAMPKHEVLARIADHARGTMENFIQIKGGLPFIDLDKAQQADKLHLLKKFRVTKQGVEIELHDAQSALRDLGRAHGIFKDRTELSGNIWEQLMGNSSDSEDEESSDTFT